MAQALTIITAPHGKYGEGSMDFDKAYVYIAVFNSAAQTWALYCLMLLYFAFHGKKGHHAPATTIGDEANESLVADEAEDNNAALLPPNTHIQAIVVKGVVFVSFWQSVLVAILVSIVAPAKNVSAIYFKSASIVSSSSGKNCWRALK